MLATVIKPQIDIASQPVAILDLNPKPQVVVVTGGAGYIGAHTVLMLLKSGFTLVVIDDFSTGLRENLQWFEQNNIAHDYQPINLFEGDFADPVLWASITNQFEVLAVIHLAGKIDANESLTQPELYLEANFQKTKLLLEILQSHKINKLVFASTAAVYGNCHDYPITEQSPLDPLNPYGQSKLLAEQAIEIATEQEGLEVLQAVALRFFNAAGTDPELNILPQNPHGLLQKLKAVIDGVEPVFAIYGGDYDTPDGTCIRDLVNVVDIARAVVTAVQALIPGLFSKNLFWVFNVGSEQGYSIKQILETAQQILDKKIPFAIAPRRLNEISISVADSSLIKTELNFDLQYSDLETILRTSLI